MTKKDSTEGACHCAELVCDDSAMRVCDACARRYEAAFDACEPLLEACKAFMSAYEDGEISKADIAYSMATAAITKAENLDL